LSALVGPPYHLRNAPRPPLGVGGRPSRNFLVGVLRFVLVLVIITLHRQNLGLLHFPPILTTVEPPPVNCLVKSQQEMSHKWVRPREVLKSLSPIPAPYDPNTQTPSSGAPNPQMIPFPLFHFFLAMNTRAPPPSFV
jgi:hypothetical protein